MTDESYWPVRNIAEYAYCPRLFYLMEVEGTYLPSDDTEKGKVVHKRIDRPSAETARAEIELNRPKAIRSLTLTDETLRLTATLDLAEINGDCAVPIEYRKGRPKRGYDGASPEPWPTDRVQVALQALLLRGAGYQVKHAVIYYSAERLRLEISVDDSVLAEANTVLRDAIACATGPRPAPLLNDARCLKCSLQPACLPDEVNFQRQEGRKVNPRKIWPPRDDGIHVVVQQNGVKVGVRGRSLKIIDKTGSTIKETPLVNVESLSLLGSVQMSTQALHVMADSGIPIAYCSAAGRMVAMVDPLDSVSAQVRRAQIRRLDDASTCLALAQALVVAKITNQRTLLMRNHAELPKNVPADLSREAKRAAVAPSVDAVRGHEGNAASLYFKHFAGMFKGTAAEEFDAHGRQRRPAPDPINACISMGYTMLTHECVTALRLARLEPSIGAFHVSRPGRPAFALDLMEPFRPLIADSIAVSSFNRGELTEGHFLRTAAGCTLTDAGRRAFFCAYARRMGTEITQPVFKYTLSYRRMLTLHARMIAAWLVGDISSLSFLTTR